MAVHSIRLFHFEISLSFERHFSRSKRYRQLLKTNLKRFRICKSVAFFGTLINGAIFTQVYFLHFFCTKDLHMPVLGPHLLILEADVNTIIDQLISYFKESKHVLDIF